jgi:hypothetical protein
LTKMETIGSALKNDMKVDVADNAQFYSTFDWKAGVVLPKFLSDRYEKEARLRNFECHVVGAE